MFHALRTPHALIDLRLFKNRTFAVASGTLMLMIISVFGAMLLLPLYLQAVRGESAFDSGLLLAPQGIGAMIVMPIAGQLDRQDRHRQDRHPRPGRSCCVSTLGLTQLAGDTSYWTLSAILFVMGVGMGFTMMPLMSGALQTLRRAQVAKASTSLNIIQQVGASIGTAVMSVILTVALQDRLGERAGGETGLGAHGREPAARGPRPDDERVHPHLLVGDRADRPGPAGRVPAAAAQAEPVEDEEAGAGEPAPVLMHA